jgi:hypothetical protein
MNAMIVHSFTMADVEDPEIYAAEPLLKWEKSEAGQWVMTNALETPTWHTFADHNTYGIRCVIKARLSEEDATFFTLKWGNTRPQ